MNRHVQRARRAASDADLALVRQPDLVALVDARRDRHAERPLALRPALAVARLARVRDELALALALRTGGDVDHLAEHRPAGRPDLAAATAVVAGDRLRARLGARASARLAPTVDRELDLLVGPADGLLERDPDVVTKVGTGRRVTAPRPSRRRSAEERVEDVAERAEAARVEARAAVAAETRLAEHVVGLATLRIRQDLVGLVDLLEPRLGARIRVHVRVPLLGKAAECLLDLGVGRGPLDAEGGVVVELGGHLRAKSSRRSSLGWLG